MGEGINPLTEGTDKVNMTQFFPEPRPILNSNGNFFKNMLEDS